jgi:sensor histidine kinase YesM
MLRTVEDNGEGIDQKQLPELLTKPANIKDISLDNIHTCIIRLYGEGLAIHSSLGVGTVTKFKIPL